MDFRLSRIIAACVHQMRVDHNTKNTLFFIKKRTH